MSDLNDLEERLETALSRIAETLRKRAASPAPASDENGARIAELERECEGLRANLEALRSERARDVAELEALLAQLRPLVEEVG